MYILVTYDVREERARRKIRALLRKYSFSMLALSVYIGRGNRGIAERLAYRISKMLGKSDRAAIILLQDFQYELLMDITRGDVRVRGEEHEVLVFTGRKRSRSTNVDTGRSSDLRAESASPTTDNA